MTVIDTDMGSNPPFVPTVFGNVLPDHVEDHMNDYTAEVSDRQMGQKNAGPVVREGSTTNDLASIDIPINHDIFEQENEIRLEVLKQKECAITPAGSQFQPAVVDSNHATLVIENENLRDALTLANDSLEVGVEQIRRLKEELGHINIRQFQVDKPASVEEVLRTSLYGDANGTPLHPLKPVVRIGASALCFDIPDQPISEADLAVIFDDLAVSQVKHVWLGTTGEGVRWNVLGDISIKNPWFAQLLACTMGFTKPNAAIAACIFLELNKTMTSPQLRDVLTICESVQVLTDRQITSDEGGPVSSGIATIFSRLSIAAKGSFISEVVDHFDGLLLCPDGDTFLDIRRNSKETATDSLSVFSLQELAESSVPRLFVIHVDALDGPFVLWISTLLETMAWSYSQSIRHPLTARTDVGQDRDISGSQVTPIVGSGLAHLGGEAEPVKEQTLLEVGAVLSSLSIQLRRLGVPS